MDAVGYLCALLLQNVWRGQVRGPRLALVEFGQADPQYCYDHKQGEWEKSHTSKEVEEQVGVHRFLCDLDP